jgi:hypothetical protein
MEITEHYQGLLALFQKCGKLSGFKVSTERVVLTPIGQTGAWELALAGGPLSLVTDVAKGNQN